MPSHTHTHTHRRTQHSCFPISLAAIQVIRLAHIHETGSEREQLSSNRENVLAHYRRRRPSVSPGAKPRHSTKKSAGVSVRARMWVLVILPAAITSTVGLLNRRSSLSPAGRAFSAASSGRWTTTLGSLNKCDYTC